MNERKRFVILLVLLLLSLGLMWYVQHGIDNNFVNTLP